MMSYNKLTDDVIKSKLSDHGINLGVNEYEITIDGIFKAKKSKELIEWLPISGGDVFFPSCIIEDAETGRSFVELTHWNPFKHEFQEMIFERSILGSTSELVKRVSPFIIGIDSLNARDLVKFFSIVLQNSKTTIKRKSLLTHAGWFNGEFVPFSEKYLLKCSEASPLKHIRPVGSESEWLGVVSRWYEKSLYARISLAIAFASPLLESVGSLPFIVHFSGNTGCGKTFYQRLCASVYGGCDDNQYLFSMNSTDNGLESTLIELSNLPAVVDEIQIQSNRYNFSELIYRITEGASKRRCTIDGSLNENAKGSWRLIFYSSGEEFFSSNSRTKGVENRIIDIALPTVKELEAEMIEDVYKLINNNGHAGTKYIKAIKEITREVIRSRHKHYRELIKESCPDATGKQLPAVALLLLGDELGRKYILKDVKKSLTVEDLTPFIKTAKQVDNQAKAFITLINLINHNQAQFVEFRDNRVIFGGISQINIKEIWGLYNDDYYWILTSLFDEKVADAGNDPASLKKWLKRNGTLILDIENENAISHRIQRSGFRGYYYKLDKNKIDEIMKEYQEV